MRISSNIASGENFYTDLNGFQVNKFYSSRKTETLENLFRWFEGSDIQNYLYKQTFIPCQVWDMYKMRSPGDHFSNKYFRKANIKFFSGPRQKLWTPGSLWCQANPWEGPAVPVVRLRRVLRFFSIVSMKKDKSDIFNSFQIFSTMRDLVEHFIYEAR